MKIRRIKFVFALCLCAFVPLCLFSFSTYAFENIELLYQFGSPGLAQGLFTKPQAVFVSKDIVYVADTGNSRIQIFDIKGNFIQGFGEKGNKPGSLNAPEGLVADKEGSIFVADTGNNRIQKFSQDGTYITHFGGPGSGPKQFKKPTRLAFFEGILFVLDSGNVRVQRFTQEGIYLGEIGGRELFAGPKDIDVDIAGNLYVLDSANSQVYMFDSRMNSVGGFGSKGQTDSALLEPAGIGVDGYGMVYVADTGNGKVKKFSMQGVPEMAFGSAGDGPGQFKQMSDVTVQGEQFYVLDAELARLQVFKATKKEGSQLLKPAANPFQIKLAGVIPDEAVDFAEDAQGNIYVIKSKADHVFVYDSGFKMLRSMGNPGKEAGQLQSPAGVFVDSEGNVWVADTGNNRIQKFSKEGLPALQFGKGGSKEGEFSKPLKVLLSKTGNIYVLDSGNKRVQIFNPQGIFLGQFGKTGEMTEPVDMAFAQDGSVYVADKGKGSVLKFDEKGSFMVEFGKKGKGFQDFQEPRAIEINSLGEVFVLDSAAGRIQVFDTGGKFLRQFGATGSDPGDMKTPLNFALLQGFTLYVADTGNKRIQKYALLYVPSVPEGLKAEGKPKSMGLSWTKNGDPFTARYRVYRAESEQGPFAPAGEASEPGFLDEKLEKNKTYFYKITALGKSGEESPQSPVASGAATALTPSTPSQVSALPGEGMVRLSWDPSPETFTDHYKIYRSLKSDSEYAPVAEAKDPAYNDKNLEGEKTYYYKVAAVSTEGDESQPSYSVEVMTLKSLATRPNLEFIKVELSPVFSSNYKFYANHPIGKIVLKNNSEQDFPKLKVSIFTKEFMDFPADIDPGGLKSGEEKEIQVTAVFNNKVLDITEDTEVQAEIKVTYFLNQEQAYAETFAFRLLEPHALVWAPSARIATFVTPKDPVVADFARGVFQQYPDIETFPVSANMIVARILFEAMGLLGTVYAEDPNNPYQVASEAKDKIDYVQYPRETLKRKSGDCDDLVNLYASLLENLSISTVIMDAPGHLFLMFDTGVPIGDIDTLGFPSDWVTPYNESLYAPVELTLVGSSFLDAWKEGAKLFSKWNEQGQITFVDLWESWLTYKPASLKSTDWKPAVPQRSAIEGKFKGELQQMIDKVLAARMTKYRNVLSLKPKDIEALTQLGIIYAETGKLPDAVDKFKAVMQVDPQNASAYNNLGNVYFLQGNFKEAKQNYEKAASLDSADAEILVNLAQVYLKLGSKTKAKDTFSAAVKKDVSLKEAYPELAEQLIGSQ